MTDIQIDKIINNTQNVIWKDGIASIKIMFKNELDLKKFISEIPSVYRHENKLIVVYTISAEDAGESTVYAAEILGYVVSMAIYDCNASSIKVI